MKQCFLVVIPAIFIGIALAAQVQKPVYPKPNKSEMIPFGQKLPSPAAPHFDAKLRLAQEKKWGSLPYITYDSATKTNKLHFPGRLPEEAPGISPGKRKAVGGGQSNNATAFSLAKDINFRAESDPSNYHADLYPSQFAVLNSVAYFYADDGIHGRELWRSDGTPAGTSMVKDINPGEGSSGDFDNHITTANGKLYFRATNGQDGIEPWVSDGTDAGTVQLQNINNGEYGSYPSQFVEVNGVVFFVASGEYGYDNLLFKTNGTPAGTTLVTNVNNRGGYYLRQATAANGVLFFTLNSWWTGNQLWLSDGTEEGTRQVKQIGYYGAEPMQLTAYAGNLYFSADDGTGRRLWVSDGTESGTRYAPGFNDVLLRTDYIGNYTNIPFPVLNNVLYLSGFTYCEGSGLYKYDAANSDGLVLVKDLTPTYDDVYFPPGDMVVAGNTLYLKVISSIGGYHDELWRSDGTNNNTYAYKTFDPGIITYAFVNGYGTLYFGAQHPRFGREFWRSNGTEAGTVMVKDIWPGVVSSAPYYFTPVNGKILMNAADPQKGASLYASDGTETGTVLLKDINTNSTGSSYPSLDYVGLVPLQNGVFFTAFEREFGREPYFSDGTGNGTYLLQDLQPGENSSSIQRVLVRNGLAYFIAYRDGGIGLYKTSGAKGSVQKLLDLTNNPVISFTVTDNGFVFYAVFDENTYSYRVWRTDGTPGGTFALASTYYNGNIVSAGNTVFFVGGDYEHGYELWKSDGTINGTGMVKDINPGWNGSYPYSLFGYDNQIYFGAYDGGITYSFWKSDGTANGTIKLKDVTPASAYNPEEISRIYAVSKKTVYVSAYDYFNAPYSGSELFKTDGTPKGTVMVKNINPNPYSGSYPYYLTDVDGTLFFTADDGEHGVELWATDGTDINTRLVKDISPGFASSYPFQLCSAGGKLFFTLLDYSTGTLTVWVSDYVNAIDPVGNNTQPLNDDVVNGLTNIGRLAASGNKVYLTGYSYKYGDELYVADVTTKPVFVLSGAKRNASAESETTGEGLSVSVSPNPAHGAATLYLKNSGPLARIILTDITGKTVWQQAVNNRSQLRLPMEKLSAGIYFITVRNGRENKTVRFVKE